MAGAPRFKIYDGAGRYWGCLKEPEACAALIGFYGDGSTIRDGHAKRCTVWTEGDDGCALNSFDHVAEVVWRRIEERGAVLARKGLL